MTCPTDREWILLSMDLVEEDRAGRMAGHLDSCRACQEKYDAARGDDADLVRALELMDRDHDKLRDHLKASLSAGGPFARFLGRSAGGWRRLGGLIMDHPKTRRAAGLLAAASILVFAVLFFMDTNGQVAFGQVVESLQNMKTMVCRTATRINVKGQEITLDGKIHLSEDLGARCDFTFHGEPVWTIFKPAHGPVLMFSPLFKSCIEKPIQEPGSLADRMHHPDAFLEQLKTLTGSMAESIGVKEFEGRRIEGFEIAPGMLKVGGAVPISV
ncbi:MAG: anti-sigma factor family protein, partial [Planctomycetota bacterium]